MSETRWAEVDGYIADALHLEDDVLTQVRAANAAAGLPAIDVSPALGRLLGLLVAISGARKVLEIGTLGGYSSICMARALPDGGRLVTLEASAEHAEIARANAGRAGLSDRIEVRTGRALDTLPALQTEGIGPFDFVFIDADKSSNRAYLDWAARLGQPGTVVIVDNVIRDGDVADPRAGDSGAEGARAVFEVFGGDDRFTATALQTVGAKGYDGFAIAVIG